MTDYFHLGAQWYLKERSPDDITFNGQGRKIIKRNWKALFKNNARSGYIGMASVMLCFNREGVVMNAEILPQETTTTNSKHLKHLKHLKQVLVAAIGYRIEEDQNAPFEECGKLVFNFDINGTELPTT